MARLCCESGRSGTECAELVPFLTIGALFPRDFAKAPESWKDSALSGVRLPASIRSCCTFKRYGGGAPFQPLTRLGNLTARQR
jgi:hypothetical protein